MWSDTAETTTFAGKISSKCFPNPPKRQQKPGKIHGICGQARLRRQHLPEKSPANVSEFSARKRCSAAL